MDFNEVNMTGPFYAEKLDILPPWNPSYESREIYVNGKKYLGTYAGWEEMASSGGSASNSDTVDNIHASITPLGNVLLALDDNGWLPTSAYSVNGFTASTSASPNTLVACNINSKIPASITGDAQTVGGFPAYSSATSGALIATNSASKLPCSITGDSASCGGFTASATTGPNRLVATNSSSKIPASITGDADTCDGFHASQTPTPNTILVLDNNGLIPAGAYSSVPVGSILANGNSYVQTGYFECNGAAISRTTYSYLFSQIGTTWGSGNGSTTFNIPDLRGYFLRGWSHGSGVDPYAGSRTGGDSVGSVQPQGVGPVIVSTGSWNPGTGGGQFALLSPYNPGGGGGPEYSINNYSYSMGNCTETRPVNKAVMYVIKY